MNTSRSNAVRDFCERLATDSEMRAAMQDVDSEAGVLEAAQSFGFEFGADDVRSAIAGTLLSEDDLDGIFASGSADAIPITGDRIAPSPIRWLGSIFVEASP